MIRTVRLPRARRPSFQTLFIIRFIEVLRLAFKRQAFFLLNKASGSTFSIVLYICISLNKINHSKS